MHKEVAFFYRGRWALSYALQRAGVEKGDNIGLQAFTCTAVPQAIVSLGAIPIFIDTDKSLCLSVDDLKLKIKNNLKVLVIQYTYGITHDFNEIVEICEKNKVKIIEDCCHLPFNEETFSIMKHKSLGQFFSFEWGKPIPAGIGGSLVFDPNYLPSADITIPHTRAGFLALLKIEIQYIVFRFFYNPLTYFILKRLFRFFSNLGLAEGNSADLSDIFSKDFERKLSISPFVKKRVLSSDIKKISNNYQRSKSIILKKIKTINSILINNQLHDVLRNQDYLLRYPVFVKDKAEVLRQASLSKIEIGDWYSTPVDPLEEHDLKILNWEVSSCRNAILMSEHIVTIPLNSNHSLKVTEKTANFLKEFL